jgi:cytochrome c oxidase subunit 2
MLSEADLLFQNFGFRLLEVNNRLKMLYLINTCFLVTSTDVLHSWALPSLGLKTDACPGRINRMVVWPSRQGIYGRYTD